MDLTVLPIRVRNAADALRYVGWYSQRWLIEELFSCYSKQKGYASRRPSLESGAGLKKLIVLALQVGLR